MKKQGPRRSRLQRKRRAQQALPEAFSIELSAEEIFNHLEPGWVTQADRAAGLAKGREAA